MEPVIETTPKVENGTANGAGTTPVEPSEAPGLIAPMDEANRKLVANVHPPTWQNPTPGGKYNLLVIGGGSAGLLAAAGSAGLGAKVALVERHLLGGDCLNVGCVPSKAVIRAGKVLGEIARAKEFGIDIGGAPQVDFGAIMQRMRWVRADISDHDSVMRFEKLGIDVFLGDGHFTGPNTFVVGDKTLEFARAVIATGSRPAVPPIEGLQEAGYLTNETVFQLTELPRRLAVIGAGPIGAELSQSFRRFGSEVTIIEMGERIMGREDAEAAALLAEVFQREGIRLELGAKVQRVEQAGDGNASREKVIVFEVDGTTKRLAVDNILVAVGRAPNIESLNLDAAGVKAHRRGVEVNDQLQTSNDAIYAAGDVGFKYQFTHTADATARIVLQNALFPLFKKKASDLVVPWCTYTDPEVAHVGMYPADAEAQGIQVDTFVQPIADTDRGRADGDKEGFVKVHVKQGTDKILGATIVARHAGEMINEITLAMVNGHGLSKLAQVIHPYPTQAEAIRKVADAYNRTRLTPLVQKLFSWWLARSR